MSLREKLGLNLDAVKKGVIFPIGKDHWVKIRYINADINMEYKNFLDKIPKSKRSNDDIWFKVLSHFGIIDWSPGLVTQGDLDPDSTEPNVPVPFSPDAAYKIFKNPEFNDFYKKVFEAATTAENFYISSLDEVTFPTDADLKKAASSS